MTHRARNHFLIALGLLILTGVAYYFIFTYIAGLSKKIGVLQYEIGQKTLNSERSAQAKNALTALTSSEASINARFISPTDVVTYLEAVERTGKGLGSTVKVDSVVEDTGNPVGHLLLTLTVTGSFESVQRTLGVLDNTSTDSTINALTMNSTQSLASSTTLWTAATTLSIGIRAGASGVSAVPVATQGDNASSTVPARTTTTSSSTENVPGSNATTTKPVRQIRPLP